MYWELREMGIFSKTMENGGKLYRLWTSCAGGEGAVIPCKPFAFDLSCDPLFYWVILDRWIIIIIIILRYNWRKLKNSFGLSRDNMVWFVTKTRQQGRFKSGYTIQWVVFPRQLYYRANSTRTCCFTLLFFLLLPSIIPILHLPPFNHSNTYLPPKLLSV